MKKILLILLGGTICTAVSKGVRSVTDAAASSIKESFLASDSFAKTQVIIDETQNLGVLSENMTTDTYNQLLGVFSANQKKGYDGFIVAHGTDTLAYSAALFSFLCASLKAPVFFVSSNAPLCNSRANGKVNFKTAVECIALGITPNVYVPYQNISDGKLYLHLGARIRQCQNYSEDFESVGAIPIDKDITSAVKTAEAYPYTSSALPLPAALSAKILKITPYPGLSYDAFSLKGISAVLHGTYHSGTFCAPKNTIIEDSSVLSLLDRCNSENIDVFFAPSCVTGEVYSSVVTARKHANNANFLYGCTVEAAYAKLLIAYTVFSTQKERLLWITTQQNHEFFA